jgi:hypothetical protein
MPDEVFYWKGRPAKDLTREELLVAIEELGKLYTEALQRHIKEIELMTDLGKAVRR